MNQKRALMATTADNEHCRNKVNCILKLGCPPKDILSGTKPQMKKKCGMNVLSGIKNAFKLKYTDQIRAQTWSELVWSKIS